LQLPTELESVDLQSTGWVASLPQTSSYRSRRFQFQVETLVHNGVSVPFKGQLRLTWYAPFPSLQVGEHWQLTVRLKRPHGLMNPAGFDYERWLYVNGIAARGYVRQQPHPQRLGQTSCYPLQRLRQQIAERFSQQLSASPYRGILTALAIGDRQYIESWQWTVFTRTGTSHLLAISGLHVGLVAGLVFLLVRRMWGWLPALAIRWPSIKAAALAALLGAAGYALLAGLALPTRRAFSMIAVATLAVLWQRPVPSSRVLALALLAVLVLEPTAPLRSGFWLSFGAVATILYYVAVRSQGNLTLSQWIGLQLAIFLALLPITLILFQQMTLFSPLANLIAIPWVSVTVVPLTLLAVLAGAINESLQYGLLALATLTLDWLWAFLEWLANLPGAHINWSTPPTWTLLFVLPAVLLLFGPPGLPGRWLGALLYLPVLWFPIKTPNPGEVWFTLLDVGEGLAAVVRTAKHSLVYDTGPRRSAQFDAGRTALVPFLRGQGITQADMLIVSHADNAHMGGTRSLLESITVDQVLTSSPRQVPVEGAKPCQAGMNWEWDGVRFQVLHPPEEEAFFQDNASCVLLVDSQFGRIMLVGDIGPPAMTALVNTYGEDLAAQVLVASGTREPPKTNFLAAVQPHYVLFSTGYKSRYPTSVMLNRYQATKASILNTAYDGSITFRLRAGQSLEPERYRQQAQRYWHHSSAVQSAK
jgi:competence protein ComEC